MAPNECASHVVGRERSVHELDRLVGRDTVGAGEASEPSDRVEAVRPGPPVTGMHQWCPHAGGHRGIPYGSPGSCEVEVEQTDRSAVAEHNVLHAHVVV